MSGITLFRIVVTTMLVVSTFVAIHQAIPLRTREEIYSVDEEEIAKNPFVARLLANLEQDLLAKKEYIEAGKRGLDLGLSRGFSGSQAAKHLMGLAAANFAGGPGRRRRSPPS